MLPCISTYIFIGYSIFLLVVVVAAAVVVAVVASKSNVCGVFLSAI